MIYKLKIYPNLCAYSDWDGDLYDNVDINEFLEEDSIIKEFETEELAKKYILERVHEHFNTYGYLFDTHVSTEGNSTYIETNTTIEQIIRLWE